MSSQHEPSLRILLVEDDSDFAGLIRDKASRQANVPLDIHHVAYLKEALVALDEQTVDALVLDLMLPDSRGIETFLELHQAHPEVPVVVTTGIEDEALAVTAMENGAQDYIYKGDLTIEGLIHSLRWAIARQHASKARVEAGVAKRTDIGQIDPSDAASRRLRDEDPDTFEDLASRYGDLLDRAVERWVYQSDQSLDEDLQRLTHDLSSASAGPRDVTDIHTVALQTRAGHPAAARTRVFVDQGRLLALQVMGHLAAHYREQAAGRGSTE